MKRPQYKGCLSEERGAPASCPHEPVPEHSTAATPLREPLWMSPEPRHVEQQDWPVEGQGCAVRGPAPPRMDSLEETLLELEATLSQMGLAPATGSPGSPPSPTPGPQVAVALLRAAPVCKSHLCIQRCRVWGAMGAPGKAPHPLFSAAFPLLLSFPLSLTQASFAGRAPGRLGSWSPWGSGLPLAGPRTFPLCSVSVTPQIKFSASLSPVPLARSCLTLSLSFFCCAYTSSQPLQADLGARVVPSQPIPWGTSLGPRVLGPLCSW